MKTKYESESQIRENSATRVAGNSDSDLEVERATGAQSRMQFGAPRRRAAAVLLLLVAVSVLCGCQELIYTGPNGEHFSRRCLGTSTSIGRLSIDTSTNGVRRVQLQGYQNDGTQTLGVVTEAAVRAAIQGATK